MTMLNICTRAYTVMLSCFP